MRAGVPVSARPGPTGSDPSGPDPGRPGPSGPDPAGALTATGLLVRLIVRRDRLRLPLWIGGLVALMAVSAQSVAAFYRTPASIESYVRTIDGNPALIVFAGPGYGFDDPTVGAILVNETSLWMALGCALMSAFLVNRHTRAEEESERADLVRSTVVGRHAPVAAAVLVAAGANLAVGALSALAAMSFGFSPAGTGALTVGFALVGLTFAAITAVAVQVAGTSRGALGLATGVIGLAFVVRGIGDVSAPALAWATPFGWGIGIRAFAGERWWVLVGLVCFTAVSLTLAFALSVRRDLGSGLVPSRPGPVSGPGWASRPLGLAFRLQRGPLVGWASGLFVMAMVYGSVADDVDTMLADNPELGDYLAQVTGATLTEAYLATALRLLALVVAGFAVSSALRNRSDETAGYAESMLAAAVSRWWWAGSHLVVTAAGTVALVAVAGFGLGLGYSASVGDWSQLGTLAAASLANLPAVLVLVGVATVLFGWVPRATAAAWAALAVVALVELFGTVLRLPHWLTLVSPLRHVPSVPARDWEVLPLALLTMVAATLVGAGLVGFRRRDLTAA